VYVTNLAASYRGEYLARLESMGAPVSLDRIVSSARATALYLANLDPRPARTLVVGAPGLRRELTEVGLDVMDAGERGALLAAGARGGSATLAEEYETLGRPDVVVVGLDPEVTYAKLAAAVVSIRSGAKFVATNLDPALPTEGSYRPGAGSLVAAVQAATGVTPVSLGKPSREIMVEAARTAGANAADAIMIGDGLATDIGAAKAVGCRSILMLTGTTKRSQLDGLPAAQAPDEVAADAAELAVILERLASA
jgi:4-nitrophenyl phosphatase